MTHQVIEWKVSPGLTDYQAAVAAMESRVAGITDGTAGELVWLLEHPPVYTGGTSAVATDLVDPRFPVVPTGRGGKFTYHGPGQRIGYVMLDLRQRRRDVRCYVHALEGWVIAALGELGVVARRAPGRVGIWVDTERGEEKVGAIGVRVRRWVTLHGCSVNIAPDLSHFGGIVPCGLPDHGVTSLAALGVPATMVDFDAALLRALPEFEDKVGRKQFA